MKLLLLVCVSLLALFQLACLVGSAWAHDWPFVAMNALLLGTIHPYNIYMAYKRERES